MDSSLNRRRTAMVLHELEQSLGNYILNTEISLDEFPEEMIKLLPLEKINETHQVI